MIVLDTDHASELGYRSVAGLRLLARLGESGEETVITAVTVDANISAIRRAAACPNAAASARLESDHRQHSKPS